MMRRYQGRFVQLAAILLCMGCATAQVVPDVYSEAEMKLLVQQWKKSDGETTFIVADRLSVFLEAAPETFLQVMSRERGVLQAWLDNLGGTSFRNYGGSCIDRACLREGMLRAVARVKDPGLVELAREVKAKIEATPVTTVD